MNAPTVATPLQQPHASHAQGPDHSHAHTHHHHDHDHVHSETPRAATVPRRSPITVGAFGRLAVAAGLATALWLVLTWALA